MKQFANKSKKKPVFGPFWAHFPNFWGKKIIPENPALSCTTSHGILPTCQNLEKINDTVPRKCLGRWRMDWSTDRRKDTLFYRTLMPTARGPKKRTKNNPCLTIQKLNYPNLLSAKVYNGKLAFCYIWISNSTRRLLSIQKITTLPF